MGKLKDFFFETVPEETTKKETSSRELSNSNAPEIDVSKVDLARDIISQAYEQFSDSKFDIFVVEELYANFDGIPEDTKMQLIRKNLSTLKIDLNEVIDESVRRKDAINAVSQEHKNASEALGKDISSQIEEARSLIDKLTSQNIERKNKLEAELAGVDAELKRLDNIIHILGGTK
ncbi:hypothetical protein [Lactococcus sp. UBA7220]|uniref:hypothetical protein n=1 Tax=Lactococcus sp. UBA7220 TaxID=1946735 RepID=UPI00257AB086|nr:hypothetical protein [Lactococcus sp. UBA7220]